MSLKTTKRNDPVRMQLGLFHFFVNHIALVWLKW